MEQSSILSSNVILGSLAAGLSFVFLLSHFYYKSKFSYWEKRGIKGPKPIPFFGNSLDLLYRKSRAEIEKEWAKKYGKVYGVYKGSKPHLVIADVDLLKQICIKDFEDFPNHHRTDFMNKYQKKFLIFLKDEEWKKMRAFLSPTFTSGKIRRMFKLMEHCSEDLVNCFREQLASEGKSNGIINARDLYSLFTMDAIATCCYGLKLNRAGSADLKTMASRDDFVRICSRMLNFDFSRILTSMFVPKSILFYFGFSVIPEARMKLLSDRVEQLIKKRRSSGQKFDDYLQLLIDAKIDDKLELDDLDLKENHHAGLTKESLLEDQQNMVRTVTKGNQKVELSDLEIIASGTFLLFVALETTGTLLTSCTYALAFHQDIQEELYEELMKIAKVDKEKKSLSFDYDDLTSCQYLDAVISETLRLMAPVFDIDRLVKNDYFIEKYNLMLPKGSVVDLALYAILNHPDYWNEPESFKPDRFLHGNKEKIVPGSYCPFGLGPRHCIGMRFSLTEAKLALAKIITSFRVSPAPGTLFPPERRHHPFLNGIKDPLVTITQRVQYFD